LHRLGVAGRNSSGDKAKIGICDKKQTSPVPEDFLQRRQMKFTALPVALLLDRQDAASTPPRRFRKSYYSDGKRDTGRLTCYQFLYRPGPGLHPTQQKPNTGDIIVIMRNDSVSSVVGRTRAAGSLDFQVLPIHLLVGQEGWKCVNLVSPTRSRKLGYAASRTSTCAFQVY
jgi:hypothetical protein